jgi:hypothetical protein
MVVPAKILQSSKRGEALTGDSREIQIQLIEVHEIGYQLQILVLNGHA